MKQLETFPPDGDICRICGTPLPLDRIYAYSDMCEECEQKQTCNEIDDTWTDE